jgi:indolepyruvate ferredoxin oxidoreductase beta subunit
MSFNILLTGVGGQGLMLLSAVIGEACVESGIKVVTQEQHGLAQRSGSISAHIRIGEAYSPLIPYGSADQIIAMEAMEALRYIEYLKPNGQIIMNTRLMHPVIETSEIVNRRQENTQYITLEQIKEKLDEVTKNIHIVNAQQLASEASNPRTENIVLLGAASKTNGFPLSNKQLLRAIETIVPARTIGANIKAFSLGEKA